ATSTYAYDHTTERIKKTANSVTTIYPNDLWNKATSGATATTTRHIFDNQGTLLATVEGNGAATSTKYLHPDHLNSTNAVSDSTGELLQTLDYYPYGDERIATGTFTSQRQFIGEIKDQETDLSYLNARYYDGNRGQFTSQDPMFWRLTGDLLIDPQQQNSYGYARNNPLRFIDPTGLFNIKTGEIEKGDTLSKIRNQINKEYGTSLSVSQLTKANGIKNPNKIYTGNFIVLPGQNPRLTFNGQSLQVYDRTYNTDVPSLNWTGTSGDSSRGYASIPEGLYRADPANVQYWKDVGFANKVGSTLSEPIRYMTFGIKEKTGFWPGGSYAWGEARTELSNIDTSTEKTGYYIHGGSRAGSAGCIDLTDDNNAFHSWLSSYGKPIDVTVSYPQ
ncbi:LysM peptidoglycan-binding domain-containing protein, partial [Candidatus Kaiserbacteria bacterium]|nr:LysM peptidoglycan-binding domain-containing protein [Candidatus Kaiserbacteria bacterium]